jgi:ABC-2 type transport system permease protein
MNILPIVRKEFRQIKRDKRILSVLLFIPAMMLMMFGYALNFDVKHTSMAVYDEDRSKVSRQFIEQFFVSEYFTNVQTLASKAEINDLLDGEHVRVVLVVPSTFTKDIQRGRAASVQVIVDGANSNAATTVLGYINAIIQQYSVKVMAESFIRMGRQNITMPIDFQPRVWYNPELKSAKFLVPGLIAFILMVTAVVSTALAIVRERELGTLSNSWFHRSNQLN